MDASVSFDAFGDFIMTQTAPRSCARQPAPPKPDNRPSWSSLLYMLSADGTDMIMPFIGMEANAPSAAVPAAAEAAPAAVAYLGSGDYCVATITIPNAKQHSAAALKVPAAAVHEAHAAGAAADGTVAVSLLPKAASAGLGSPSGSFSSSASASSSKLSAASSVTEGGSGGSWWRRLSSGKLNEMHVQEVEEELGRRHSKDRSVPYVGGSGAAEKLVHGDGGL